MHSTYDTTIETRGYAPVTGLKMYYEIEGTGDPLIYLPPAVGCAGLNSFPGLAQGHDSLRSISRGMAARPISWSVGLALEQNAEDARCKAIIVHQVLVDGLGIAALAEREFDEIEEGLAGARRRASGGLDNRCGVGGHLVGRFCRWAASPRARKPDRNARGFQIGRSRLSPNFGFFLDAPQRPAQSPQRNDLLSFLFAQDIHTDER